MNLNDQDVALLAFALFVIFATPAIIIWTNHSTNPILGGFSGFLAGAAILSLFHIPEAGETHGS